MSHVSCFDLWIPGSTTLSYNLAPQLCLTTLSHKCSSAQPWRAIACGSLDYGSTHARICGSTVAARNRAKGELILRRRQARVVTLAGMHPQMFPVSFRRDQNSVILSVGRKIGCPVGHEVSAADQVAQLIQRLVQNHQVSRKQ